MVEKVPINESHQGLCYQCKLSSFYLFRWFGKGNGCLAALSAIFKIYLRKSVLLVKESGVLGEFTKPPHVTIKL